MSDEVSTGSGSDWVSIHVTIEFAGLDTRSLPLPVLTAHFHCGAECRTLPHSKNLVAAPPLPYSL
jgi:hypothetical protein